MCTDSVLDPQNTTGVVLHTYTLHIKEIEAGRSEVQGQP